MQALKDHEIQMAHGFLAYARFTDERCFVRSKIGDTEVCLVAHVDTLEDGSADIQPMFILVTDEVFALLTDPQED